MTNTPLPYYYDVRDIENLVEQLLVTCRLGRDPKGLRVLVRGDRSRAVEVAKRAISDLIGQTVMELNLTSEPEK